jgi:hypothetical protein
LRNPSPRCAPGGPRAKSAPPCETSPAQSSETTRRASRSLSSSRPKAGPLGSAHLTRRNDIRPCDCMANRLTLPNDPGRIAGRSHAGRCMPRCRHARPRHGARLGRRAARRFCSGRQKATLQLFGNRLHWLCCFPRSGGLSRCSFRCRLALGFLPALLAFKLGLAHSLESVGPR